MNTKKYFSIIIGFAILFISCSDSFETSDDLSGLDDPINDFIWQGLNSWYNWQEESADLSDSKDDNPEDYYTFLNSYSDYESLMLDLCYRHSRVVGSSDAVDRFSWFVEDYEIQKKSFQGRGDD